MENADDFRKTADILDKLDKSIAKAYIDKTGQDEDVVRAAMKEESWLDADEAIEMGMINGIEQADDEDEAEESAKATIYDLKAVYPNAPEALLAEFENNTELTEREAEKALRDAGASRSQAKGIVAKGFKEELSERDAQDDLEEDSERDAPEEPENHQRDADNAQSGNTNGLLVRAAKIAKI